MAEISAEAPLAETFDVSVTVLRHPALTAPHNRLERKPIDWALWPRFSSGLRRVTGGLRNVFPFPLWQSNRVR
jgi:hypothetical protein